MAELFRRQQTSDLAYPLGRGRLVVPHRRRSPSVPLTVRRRQHGQEYGEIEYGGLPVMSKPTRRASAPLLTAGGHVREVTRAGRVRRAARAAIHRSDEPARRLLVAADIVEMRLIRLDCAYVSYPYTDGSIGVGRDGPTVSIRILKDNGLTPA
jgi:hypothetical protein